MEYADIASRIRAIRDHMNLSADLMAETVGLKTRKSWYDYERGNHLPTGAVLHRLAELGIDTNWVLTGEGEMLKGTGLHSPALPQNGVDRTLLSRVHKGVSEVYRSENVRISADALADEVAEIYDDLTAAYDSAEKRLVGLDLALHQLRRDVRLPPAEGGKSKSAS